MSRTYSLVAFLSSHTIVGITPWLTATSTLAGAYYAWMTLACVPYLACPGGSLFSTFISVEGFGVFFHINDVNDVSVSPNQAGLEALF